MATKLFLRNTQDNAIGAGYFDMVIGAGAGSVTGVVNSVTGPAEVQWTQTAGGTILQWVSGRAPVGGFTLTTTDISVWCHESAMAVNAQGRFRLFTRTLAAVETEILGGPFNDGVEFGTAAAEMLWAGNVTDTLILEDVRLLLKLFITDAPTLTMAAGTCTVTYNAADAATGDSFFNIAETVTFKAEDVPVIYSGRGIGRGLGRGIYR